MTNSPAVAAKPSLTAESEKAARAVINRYVREKVIARATGNQVLAFAVPFVPPFLADLRRKGMSAEDVTQTFQAKLADAQAKGEPVRIICAEIHLAMWAGLQVDYAAHVNGHGERRAVTEG